MFERHRSSFHATDPCPLGILQYRLTSNTVRPVQHFLHTDTLPLYRALRNPEDWYKTRASPTKVNLPFMEIFINMTNAYYGHLHLIVQVFLFPIGHVMFMGMMAPLSCERLTTGGFINRIPLSCPRLCHFNDLLGTASLASGA